MKKYFKIFALAFSVVFVSCDKDFNTVGSDLIGNEHFDYSTDEDAIISAISIKSGNVQSNNLPVNQLGIYNNPYFGKTVSSFVSQVNLESNNPTIGTNIEMDNVVLYVPFFSTETSSGSGVYTLDSIYGATQSELSSKKMRLNIYENGYVINSFDPTDNFQSSQKYYSNQKTLFENQKLGSNSSNDPIVNGDRLNNSSDVAQNDQFYFNENPIKVYKRKLIGGNFVYVNNDGLAVNQSDPNTWVVSETLAPGIYVELNKEYFKKRVLEAGYSNLFNSNSFKQYFKGIYFQIEELVAGQGAMALLNFDNAKIAINYSSNNSTDYKTLNLKFNDANTVSLREETFSQNYSDGLTSSSNDFNSLNFGHSDRLYLKGGNGSIAYLELFGKDVDGDGVADQLEEYRAKGWLVNEAYIKFYIDQTTLNQLSKKEEPLRLYLFDATNNVPLVDYSFDTSISTNSKKNKYIHDGIIVYDANQNGAYYKIRISEHIKRLINNSANNNFANVRLGLAITETITNTSAYFVNPADADIPINSSTDIMKYVPATNVMSPLGTVLYGNSSNVSEDKRLKLTIHYTKPN